LLLPARELTLKQLLFLVPGFIARQIACLIGQFIENYEPVADQ
jgi:hypothetical protein